MRTAFLQLVLGRMLDHPNHPFVLALSGKSGLRYWPWEAPQRDRYPYAVSLIVSQVDQGAILTRITEIEWQMSIFTAELHQANDLAEACRDLFADQPLRVGPCTATCEYLATYGQARSTSADPFQSIVTFSCHV